MVIIEYCLHFVQHSGFCYIYTLELATCGQITGGFRQNIVIEGLRHDKNLFSLAVSERQ
jgi:hypothetical protein